MKEIEVLNISYRAGGRQLLQNVSLEVQQGDAVALIGENGSGKSTLLEIILNDLLPDSGTVRLFGNDKPDFKKTGVVYDQLPLLHWLKVEEMVRYFCAIYKCSFEAVEKELFPVFLINKIRHAMIRKLSQGERQRLAILLAVMHDPALLILDEPFASLDPTITESIWKLIRRHRRSVLFTTHNWREAASFATKIAFIHNGRLSSMPQPPEEILQKLPAKKKISISDQLDVTSRLASHAFYTHDNTVHIFFPENSGLIKTISQITSNFSVQDVDLKDAYLFTVKSAAHD